MRANMLLTLLISIVFGVSILTGCNPSDNSSQNTSTNGDELSPHAANDSNKTNKHTHANGDDHHHAKVPGPNGGRLITNVEPHFEFLILPNQHAQITFVSDDIKPIPPADLQIKLTGGDRSNPIEVAFEKKENTLLSAIPLPQDHNMALVLQINGKALEETVFERFHLNMAQCPDCDLQEYACICGHGVDEH